MENEPAIRDETRNEDGTYKKGFSGNLSGRPKSSVKDYLRQKLNGMSEEEKEAWLTGVAKDVQWRMAEGNPHQSSDVAVTGGLNIVFDKSFNNEPSNPPPEAAGDSKE